MALSSGKPICKYGSSCYRKNPQHIRAFAHPPATIEEVQDIEVLPDKENIQEENNSGRPPLKRAKLTTNSVDEVVSKCSPSSPCKSDKNKLLLPALNGSTVSAAATDENSTMRKRVQDLFLVPMPEDFHQFWDFCVETCPKDPSNALEPLGLTLTGPYDILAGKVQSASWEECVLHGRHFFDPPELQTVIMDNGSSSISTDKGFHIGYFRDDPKSNDCLVVSNTVSSGCYIKILGSNIFSAVKSLLEKPPKGSSRKSIKELKEKLMQKAEDLGIDLNKSRKVTRKPVSKCFNQIGISVPIDEVNDVGYRSLTLTNRELKSLLDKISKQSLDSAKESLQELVTYVQFANDECDYGMGLELGIDLFCYGDPMFHGKIHHLLLLAYDLLDRPEFGKIIKQHLQNRQKPKFALKELSHGKLEIPHQLINEIALPNVNNDVDIPSVYSSDSITSSSLTINESAVPNTNNTADSSVSGSSGIVLLRNILKGHTPQLLDALSELQITKLTNEFWAVDMLSDIAKDELITNHSISRYKRASILMHEIQKLVTVDNFSNQLDNFKKICNVMKKQNDPTLSPVVDEMVKRYEEVDHL